MIAYRCFRNDDPPQLAALWNQSRSSRGFGKVTRQDHFETFVFGKLYFDPRGLIVACEEKKIVGFAHAGFAANADQSGLEPNQGIVTMLLVAQTHRGQGIGKELLKRAQQYLADCGAKSQYAGGMFPMNPFYLGLYGGSELPGVLDSDAGISDFVTRHDYQPHAACSILHRYLDKQPESDDSRLPLLRRQVDVQVESWALPNSWWQACTLGAMPSLKYEMSAKEGGASIGWGWVWDMETHSLAWQIPVVGLTDVFIREPFRRQGYGKLLLLTILKHLREQQIALVETQTMEDNAIAVGLYEEMLFRKVDRGVVYKLAAEKTPSPQRQLSLTPTLRRTGPGPAPRFRKAVSV